jgi:hypothetical protein
MDMDEEEATQMRQMRQREVMVLLAAKCQKRPIRVSKETYYSVKDK